MPGEAHGAALGLAQVSPPAPPTARGGLPGAAVRAPPAGRERARGAGTGAGCWVPAPGA